MLARDDGHCLDATALRELVAGEFPPAALVLLGAHLRTCSECRDRVAVGAREQARSISSSVHGWANSRAVTAAYWLEQALSPEAPPPVAPSPAPLDSSASGLALGVLVGGKYRLVSPIGRGGGGTVWRAEHVSWHAPVAIKVFTEDFERTQESSARFLREVQVAAALRSPHVAQVLDHGIDESTNSPFLVLELLEGETLADRLKRSTRLGPSETLLIITHVVRALHRAHRAGVVHRDLKPSNLFIVSNDDAPHIKVLDFGVAKWSSPRRPGDVLTRPGAVLGTPWYMSPEQIKDSAELDHRADLWSLAAIACECLTGQRPFQGKDFVEIALLLQGAAQRPIPSRLGPVPEGVDAWFARATHPDIAKRFQTARELLKELIPVCGADAVLPSPAADAGMSEKAGRAASREVPSGTLLLRAVHRPVPAAAKYLLLLAAAVGAAAGLHSVMAAREGASAARLESSVAALQPRPPELPVPSQPPEVAPAPASAPDLEEAPSVAPALAASAPEPLPASAPPPAAAKGADTRAPRTATPARRTARSKSIRRSAKSGASVQGAGATPPEKPEPDTISVNGRRIRMTLEPSP